MTNVNQEEALSELLAQAVPQPSLLRSQAGGAALALVIHCLMVRDGFEPLEVVHGGEMGRRLRGSSVPPDWNKNEHFWVFEYSRPGGTKKFRLGCSFQSTTRRMFIHAAEVDVGNGEPEAENICVMGLQLDNYVPAGNHCSSSSSWDGVVANEQALSDMFAEFVGGPLWRRAEKVPEGGGRSGWAASIQAQTDVLAAVLREHRTLVLGAAAGITTVALVLLWRQHATH